MNSFTPETTQLAGVPGLAGAGERTGSARVCKVALEVTEAVADRPREPVFYQPTDQP